MKTLGAPIVETLSDVAADLFSFSQQLVKSGDPGDAEAFRLKVDELFKSFESRAKQLEHNDDNVALAKYALAAYIDEIILTSSWPLRDAWSGRPLQLEYFNDFSAGEVFYDKLDAIRGTDNPKKLEVLEIYHTCLALGFKGKYGDLSGMEKIKTLMEGMARDLHKWRSKGVQGLSPSWKCQEDAPKLVQQFPIWVVPVVCVALLLVAYITLAWILGGTVTDLKSGLNNSAQVK